MKSYRSSRSGKVLFFALSIMFLHMTLFESTESLSVHNVISIIGLVLCLYCFYLTLFLKLEIHEDRYRYGIADPFFKKPFHTIYYKDIEYFEIKQLLFIKMYQIISKGGTTVLFWATHEKVDEIAQSIKERFELTKK